MMIKKLVKIFCLLGLALVGCSKVQSQKGEKVLLEINIIHKVADSVLVLDSLYLNYLQEPFSVTNFKYYLAHFYAIPKESEHIIQLSQTYFLIDERKPENKKIYLPIPAGSYRAIGFDIGVDSLHNVSGVQENELDPANGMFWTWNTGYIMAKLEGHSPLSTAPFHKISYHIGGYKHNENALRKVLLTLPNTFKVHATGKNSIDICADVSMWFSGKNNLPIRTQSFIMTPGQLSMSMADNYARMFAIQVQKSEN